MNKKFKYVCKSITVILFCVILISNFACIASAEEYGDNIIQPRYASINTLNCSLSFTNGKGVSSGIASKKTTASNIEGRLVIYKQVGSSWVYVDETSNSVSTTILSASLNFTPESNTTYKAVWTVTAYTNEVPETAVVEKIETCP